MPFLDFWRLIINYYIFFSFKTDLDVLRKIPVIPALILSDDDSENATTTETSLLQWISSKDNQSDLEKVAEQCSCRLEQVSLCFNTSKNFCFSVSKC